MSKTTNLTNDEIEVLLRYASPKTSAKLTKMLVNKETK